MRKIICVLVTLLMSVAAQAQPEAFPSTYAPPGGQPVLFRNATILTGDGRRLDEADLYIAESQIQWVGEGEIEEQEQDEMEPAAESSPAPKSKQKPKHQFYGATAQREGVVSEQFKEFHGILQQMQQQMQWQQWTMHTFFNM